MGTLCAGLPRGTRMPSWKRIIVGDGQDVNYYRDLFFSPPFILFSIVGIIDIFSPDHRMIGLKCLALAAIALALAKERGIMAGALLGFCAVRFLFTLVVTQDWRALAGLLATGIPLGLAIRYWANYQPSYEWPKGVHIVDLLLGSLSFGLTLATAYWVTR
jgi:hypothetical protein